MHPHLCLFAANEANTVVDDSHIAFWVMAVSGCLEGLLKKIKLLGYVDAQGLPTYLN